MGISTLSLKDGDPILTPAEGASTLTFKSDGVTIPNGLHLICTDDEYNERRQLTAKIRQGTLDPKTSTFTKDKRGISIAQPLLLPDGKTVFNTVRVEIEVHPMSHNSILSLLSLGTQVALSSDTTDFWNYGSLT